MPFLLLSLSESLQVWARVYFYGVIGTAGAMAFFASPAKRYLKKKLEKRYAKAGVAVPTGTGKKAVATTTTETAGDGGKAAGKKESEKAFYDNISRSASSDSLASREPVMGITQDLEREFDDAMSEIRAFEAKKRK
jgi:lysophospholipid acyltransferase